MKKLILFTGIAILSIGFWGCQDELMTVVDVKNAKEISSLHEDESGPQMAKGPMVPRANNASAFWCAEKGSIVDSEGAIYTKDRGFKANWRYNSINSPKWTRVKSPTYQGKYAWKCRSTDGRSEVATLIGYKPLIDGARWFAFAVRIDASLEAQAFLCQLHQGADAGSPPVYMKYNGSQWEFCKRTDNGEVGKDYFQRLASGTMNRNTWYHFYMKLKPGLNGTAEAFLWQKIGGRWKSVPLDWGSYRNRIGYKYNEDGSLNSWENFQFKCGIYTRNGTAYFDNISYGRTMTDLKGL